MVRLAVIGATLAAMALASGATVARADGPFGAIGGAWSGSGQILLQNGRKEDIRCNAYYTAKDQGAGLGLAIRCASPDYKIELRSQLKHDGRQITGQWEERTFNAAGDVVGRTSQNQFQLEITGSALKASMSVQTTGSNQTVSISTTGVGFSAVNIRLQRS